MNRFKRILTIAWVTWVCTSQTRRTNTDFMKVSLYNFSFCIITNWISMLERVVRWLLSDINIGHSKGGDENVSGVLDLLLDYIQTTRRFRFIWLSSSTKTITIFSNWHLDHCQQRLFCWKEKREDDFQSEILKISFPIPCVNFFTGVWNPEKLDFCYYFLSDKLRKKIFQTKVVLPKIFYKMTYYTFCWESNR